MNRLASLARRVRLALSAAFCAAVAACGGADSGPRAGATYSPDGVVEGAKPTWRPHVVLVDLSGLRFDDVVPAAAPPGGSPASVPTVFQDLLGSSAWFSQASSPSAWIAPGVATLFTGQPPVGHNIMPRGAPRSLIPAHATLAEILHSLGYRTGAFTSGGAIGAQRGFSQGFDAYKEGFRLDTGHGAVASWLAEGGASRPTFLFVEAADLDPPWPPVVGAAAPASPEEIARRVAALPAPAPGATLPTEAGKTVLLATLFDAAASARITSAWGPQRVQSVLVRWLSDGWALDPERFAIQREAAAARREAAKRLDASLSSMLVSVRATLPPKDTVLLVTSDHGCALLERPSRALYGAGRDLYDEQIHVPLWIQAPDRVKPQEVPRSAGLADVLPTVLALMGLPPPSGIGGRSLLPLLWDPALFPGRVISAEERRREEGSKPGLKRLFSLRTTRAKLVAVYDLRTTTWTETFYDLDADPGEESPLAAIDPSRFGAHFAAAVERLRQSLRGETSKINELRGRGYYLDAETDDE